MRPGFGSIAICLATAAAAFGEPKMPPPATVKVDYNRDIRPLIAAKCAACHGAKVQQSGLRLDKRQNALRGGDYGPVIIQGKSAESKLILRVVSGDGGMIMPPTGALEQSEISLLRAWIDQGADFGTAELKEEVVKPVDPKVTELISAVKTLNTRAVKDLLRANKALANGPDAGGSTALHHAAAFATPAIVKMLLDAGADIEAKNRFAQRPLHWAFASPEKVKLLLARGADVNAQANDGRTVLYLAAAQRNSSAVLDLLLDKGAKTELATSNGRTPLMAAATNGEVAMMRKLIDRKANVNALSGTGGTALMDAAASRNTEAVTLLLAHGANVNAKTKRNQTAISAAATFGSEDVVKMLLDKGAEVNVRDERGYSPLMYAAYSESQRPGIVKMLLDKGAETKLVGEEDETPVTLAGKRGDTEVARMLGVPETVRQQGGVAKLKVNANPLAPAAAVTKALAVVEKQSPTFLSKAGCNSCHNQYVPAAAAALARERGIPAPASISELSVEVAERYPERAIDMTVAAVGSVGYELFGFAARKRPADEYTDGVVHMVQAMQTQQGHWQPGGNLRPPMTSDDFISTAMAINILRVYGQPRDKAENAQRMARGAAWLDSAKATTTQEHAFQVLGLAWANASAGSIERAAKALVETQRPDGGWTQLPSMGTDAYATGEALYALAVGAKMPVTDAVYQKGMKYLLGTQAADGSWHVKTRSLPFQPYFDSGFPYAHDQWISAAGTSWASLALAMAVEQPKMSRR